VRLALWDAGYFWLGTVIGTCGEVLMTRGLPSG
jgi:hypothetical protein